MEPRVAKVYRFGPYEAELDSGQLRKQGLSIKLQDQPFQILALLLERAGGVVTREEIRQRLWPKNTFVEFDNGLNVAVTKLRAALNDDADAPRYIETVPKRGYRFIAEVVPPSPVASSAPAETVQSSAPEIISAQPSPDAIMEVTSKRRKLWPWAVAGALVVVVAVGWAVRPKHAEGSLETPTSAPVVSPVSTPVRRSVAVLSFRNASGREDAAWISTAVSEMLSTELAVDNRLRLVSGEEIAQIRLTAPWTSSDSLKSETTARLGTALNSDYLVTGTYTVLGKGSDQKLRLDARLQEANTGRILTEVAETGTGLDLFPLVQRVGDRLRPLLGVPATSSEQMTSVRDSLTSNPEAERFYSLGLERLREFDALTASDLLQQAVQRDPKFSLAHLALGKAWTTLGYDQKAREETQKAYDLSTHLLPADKLRVEGRYYEVSGQWQKAVSVYRALFALEPDVLECGLLLANAQRMALEMAPAAETIAALRRLPKPLSDDPRVDLGEAQIVGVNDKVRAAQLEQAGGQKAQARGLRLIYARFQLEQCIDQEWGTHPQEAVALCEEARQIYLSSGDRRHAAIAMRAIADRWTDEGKIDDALRSYRDALKIFREIGERANTAAVLVNMGKVLESQGKLDEAQKMFEEAADSFRKGGEKTNLGVALDNIADIDVQRGQIVAATRIREQTLALARSAGDDEETASALRNLAAMQLMTGNPQEARQLVEEAIPLMRKVSTLLPLSVSLSVFGDILVAQNDLSGARHQYEEALSLGEKAEAPGSVAEMRLNLAGVSLEEGNAVQAESLLRQALPEFEKENAKEDMASARIALGRSLLMQGKIKEAKQVAAEAAHTIPGSTDPTITLPLTILQAKLLTAEESPASTFQERMSSARKQLQRAAAGAHRIGFYDMELKSRLALLEEEIKTNASTARSNLTALENHAHSRGFELIAHKASDLLRHNPGPHDVTQPNQIN